MRALPRSTAFDSRTPYDECAVDNLTHFNWEGFLTALGICVGGWGLVALCMVRLLR